MSEWPKVAICFLTYKRTEYAIRSLRSVIKRLKYPNLGWYIASDGGPDEHYKAVMEVLTNIGVPVFGTHHERLGPGASWNKAIDESLKQCDLILWVENDWELSKELDITPYVRLLMEKENVGMVRLGYMAVGLDCHTVGHDGIHYLRIEKSTQYQYSGNPSLRHRRYFDAYPRYPTDKNPGECEIWHDQDVRKMQDSPEILWPINLPGCGWSCFSHIGTEQSY